MVKRSMARDRAIIQPLLERSIRIYFQAREREREGTLNHNYMRGIRLESCKNEDKCPKVSVMKRKRDSSPRSSFYLTFFSQIM